MEGDDGFIINDGIHEGKCPYKKVLLRQQTCDGCYSVVVEQSARGGTNNNGVGVGVGKAKGLLLGRWRQRQQERQEGMCPEERHTMEAMARRWADDGAVVQM